MKKETKAKLHILFYEPDANIQDFLPYFSDMRKRRFIDFINPAAKLQTAAAELAVCAAMKASGLPFMPPEYGYNDFGKPCIKGGFIGITHTTRAAACVVSQLPVGIDMEFDRFINPMLAGRILNRCEFSKFLDSSNRNTFLLKTWTAKESLLKLTGQGLRKGMRHTVFNVRENSITEEDGKKYAVVQKRLIHAVLNKYNSDTVEKKAGYFISVCTENPTDIEFVIYRSVPEIIDYLKNH